MLAMLVLASTLVAAEPGAPPISVESCAFVKSASFSRGVQIVFTNNAKVAASLVIFDIVHGSFRAAVVDEGTFSPGVRIDHTLTSTPLALYTGPEPQHCVVEHVHFVDGTAWSAGKS
jgi:hypothetical protein